MTASERVALAACEPQVARYPSPAPAPVLLSRCSTGPFRRSTRLIASAPAPEQPAAQEDGWRCARRDAGSPFRRAMRPATEALFKATYRAEAIPPQLWVDQLWIRRADSIDLFGLAG
jgi:hypothetical protein